MFHVSNKDIETTDQFITAVSMRNNNNTLRNFINRCGKFPSYQWISKFFIWMDSWELIKTGECPLRSAVLRNLGSNSSVDIGSGVLCILTSHNAPFSWNNLLKCETNTRKRRKTVNVDQKWQGNRDCHHSSLWTNENFSSWIASTSNGVLYMSWSDFDCFIELVSKWLRMH